MLQKTTFAHVVCYLKKFTIFHHVNLNISFIPFTFRSRQKEVISSSVFFLHKPVNKAKARTAQIISNMYAFVTNNSLAFSLHIDGVSILDLENIEIIGRNGYSYEKKFTLPLL